MQRLTAVLAFSFVIFAACLRTRGEEPSKEDLKAFMEQRDRWLYQEAAAAAPLPDFPGFKEEQMSTPIFDRLAVEHQKLFEAEKALKALRERIKGYNSKDGYKSIVKKYKRQADDAEAKLAEQRKLVDGLEKERTDEEKRVEEFNERQALAKAKWEAETVRLKEQARRDVIAAVRRRFQKTRQNFSIMPSPRPTFSADLKVGACGFLPQWPVIVAESLSPRERQHLDGLCNRIKSGHTVPVQNRTFLESVLPAEVLAAAKQQRNVRIVKVLDKRLAQVALIDGGLTQWKMFFVDIDTSGYADDSAITVLEPMRVIGTHQYETVAGAMRTSFVLKRITEKDLPSPLQMSDDEIFQLASPPASDRKPGKVSPTVELYEAQKRDKVERAEIAIASLEAEIAMLREEVARAESKLKELKTKLARMERSAESPKKASEKTRRLIEETKQDVGALKRTISESNRKISFKESEISIVKRAAGIP